jgi:hypothetical protein
VAAQVQKATDLEMSKAATRGFMQSDYNNIKNAVINSGGKVDPNADGLNNARKMLDNGAFDQYMDSDTKKSLYQEIRQNQVAAQTAGVQALNQKQMANDAAGESFKVNSYEKLQSNSLSPDDVTKAARQGIISSDEQLKMYHLIDQAGKDEMKTDPQLYNSLTSRIFSADNDPQHISDPMQFAYMVKYGLLSVPDFKKLSDAIGLVPQNRVNAFNEGQLLSNAKTMIGRNGSDPAADYKLMQFTNEVQLAKQDAVKNQRPIGPLFDPQSPQYLGNQIQKYISTPQQILQQQADKARGQIVAPAPISTQPGVIPSTAAGTNAGVNVEAINNMAMPELLKLNPKSLSPEQAAAARARYNALHAGGQ